MKRLTNEALLRLSINEARRRYNAGHFGKPEVVSVCYSEDGVERTVDEEELHLRRLGLCPYLEGYPRCHIISKQKEGAYCKHWREDYGYCARQEN